MKKMTAFLLTVLTLTLFLVGCSNTATTQGKVESPQKSPTPASTPENSPTATPSVTPSGSPTPSKNEEDTLRNLRVLLSSDIHCTDLLEWYGVSFRDRMEHWVNAVKKEHEQQPIDLLVINGDISLDYWINGGSVLEKGEGTAKIFVEEYLSKLPENLPVFILPGNHEQYGNENWLALTGNERQGYMVLGGRLFIFLDTFGGNLDPTTNHDGVYTGADTAYIEKLMAEHPEKDVYLIAHYFDTAAESAAFKNIVKNDRVKALFAGHTHKSGVIELGESWGGKTIAQTGNFAYFKDSAKQSFWGYRELIITEESAYSQYVITESDATVDGVKTHFERKILNQAGYYGTLPPLPEEPDPSAGYASLYDKIVKESIDGDAGVKESNRIGHIFDEDTATKWCVLPTSADKSVTVCWEMTESVRIDAYTISTANDHLTRNPKAWVLYGKNDPNGEWVAISAVQNAELPKETFTCSEPFVIEDAKSYKYYKLTVTENNGNDYYQFSELTLLQKK